jgi:demethoxyubiquinone hydroxylase (CLK1/Coq7/Cat5 family)
MNRSEDCYLGWFRLLYFYSFFIEYFLWLAVRRTILFLLFIAMRFSLCGLYASLFSQLLSKGIDYATVSMIIGEHFSEVDDKLINLIQLNQTCSRELTLICLLLL